jgi:hypothetical protein
MDPLDQRANVAQTASTRSVVRGLRGNVALLAIRVRKVRILESQLYYVYLILIFRQSRS